MVGQLVRRLAQAEAASCSSPGPDHAAQGQSSAPAGAPSAADPSPASGRRFAVCITGDHSTPAVFGDHSHEPVPFCLAHVRYTYLKDGQTGWGQLTQYREAPLVEASLADGSPSP